ncbi:MAG: hypothetical protein JOY85_24115, partial [Acidobacteriaceae bacterium]|nr:hypothetical protein [Acidobacteriaceae bacterium]
MRRIPELSVLLFVCWLLSLACLNPPGRGLNLEFGSLDPVAIIKVLTRVVSLFILLLLILRLQAHRQGAPILSRLFPQVLFASWATVSTIWSPL